MPKIITNLVRSADPKAKIVTRPCECTNDAFFLNKFKLTLNVTDVEYLAFQRLNYQWFPIDEVSYWGYAPFFFAIHAVQEFNWDTDKLLIHCSAGFNRSATIALFLQQVFHFENSEMDYYYGVDSARNRMESNIKKGLVPDNVVKFGVICKENPNWALISCVNELRKE